MSTTPAKSLPQVAAIPCPSDTHPIERMWIAKVNPQSFAVGIPVPMDLGAAAGIFPGGRFVALRTVGNCVVMCPVDSVAEADVRREADIKFADAIEAWVRRGNLQKTTYGRAVTGGANGRSAKR